MQSPFSTTRNSPRCGSLSGIGIIVLLIYRPQGLLAEPHLRSEDVLPPEATEAK